METKEKKEHVSYAQRLKDKSAFMAKHKVILINYYDRVCNWKSNMFEANIARFFAIYEEHRKFAQWQSYKTTMNTALDQFLWKKKYRNANYETLFRAIFSTLRPRKKKEVITDTENMVKDALPSPYETIIENFWDSVIEVFRDKILLLTQSQANILIQDLRTVIDEIASLHWVHFNDNDKDLFIRNYANYSWTFFKKHNIPTEPFSTFNH